MNDRGMSFRETKARWLSRLRGRAPGPRSSAVREAAVPRDDLREGMCPICLESLGGEVHVRGVDLLILPCGHPFHEECIDRWILNSVVCPVCKQAVDDPAPKLPRKLQWLALQPGTGRGRHTENGEGTRPVLAPPDADLGDVGDVGDVEDVEAGHRRSLYHRSNSM
ncbi:unnamed protein product [Discosporangium mesarthrocarpum]